MIKLRALKEIPSYVGPIPAGVDFYSVDPDLAEQWVRTGLAVRLGETPPLPSVPVGAVATTTVPDRPPWDHTDWAGDTVVIMASGESLTKVQAQVVAAWKQEAPERRRVIAINTTFRLAPFADVVYGCDYRWWDAYLAEVQAAGFKPAQLWTQQEGGAPLVNSVRSIRGEGLSKTRGVIHQGANGGYQAMGLAVMWGAKRLVLLGFDCKGGHWHGEHPQPLNARMPFDMWLINFRKLAPDLMAAGVEVVNCSPDSAIKVFPQRLVEEVLCSPSAISEPIPIIAEKPSSTGSAAPVMKSPKQVHQKRRGISTSRGTDTD